MESNRDDLRDLKEQFQQASSKVGTLQTAFVGLSSGMLQTLHALEPLDTETLAERSDVDPGYASKWVDAAFADELVEIDDGDVQLADLGAAFLPDAPDSLMPLAVQSVLSGRLTDRLAELVRSGEQPGEEILGEFTNIAPWFGRMLEAKFRPYFQQHVLPALEVFEEVDAKNGRVLDLGCGNGWYLRELAVSYANLTGVGVDAMEESIEEARRAAEEKGLESRLGFESTDIFEYRPERRFEVVVLNRTLHHLWGRRDELFETVDAALAETGTLILWEPAWPARREQLRQPNRRMLASRNLAEHAMGNRLLEPDEIRRALEGRGYQVEIRPLDDVETLLVAGRGEG